MSKRRVQHVEKLQSPPRGTEGHHEDLDRGWAWLVLVASFVANFVIGGCNYSVGLFHTTLMERFHASQSRTAWAASTHSALCNIGGPLSGFVADRFSVRTAVFLGATFMTLGYLLSAFAPSIEVSIITFGIIAGLGQALTFTASAVSTGFYFHKYRTSALGIACSGTAVGLFGIAPSVQAGKEHYGASRAFIVLCYFTLQVFVCAVIMRPSSLELETQRTKREATTKDKDRRKRVLVTYFKLLTCKPILCMSLSMFMHCFGMYIVFQYLPNYCIQEGTQPVQVSFVIAVSGVASAFGRLVTGFVANCRGISEVVVYAMTLGMTGVCSITFPLYASTYTGQILFAIAFGISFGGAFVTITPANIIFVGVSNMTMALGIEISFGGFATIAGPVLAGFLLDNGGTYYGIFVFAGIANVIGAGLALLAFVMGKCERCSTSEFNEETQDKDKELEDSLMPDM